MLARSCRSAPVEALDDASASATLDHAARVEDVRRVEGVDEIALIDAFLKRKYRGKDLGALLQDQKHLGSAFRKLRGAGFSTGNSIRVLKRYAAEAEQLEETEE